MTEPKPLQILDSEGKPYDENSKGGKYVKPREEKDYLVRYYEPPPLEDLAAYQHLIVDFEKRFFRNADRGHEVLAVTDIDKYIEQKRTAFEKAGSETEKELEGGMLRIALMRRAVDGSLQHLGIRAKALENNTTPDKAKLEALNQTIEKDFMDTYRLPPLRLSRGLPDVDDVLGEMQGEPLKVFTATLVSTPGVIEEFYRQRYGKTADAMECIDKITQSMQKLDKGRGGYHNQGVHPALVKLANAAKERMQLLRSDADFHEADVALRNARNEMQDILLNSNKNVPTHMPGDRKKQGAMDPLEVSLARSALNLIYDVAMTHDAQNHRAEEIAAGVESFVQHNKARGSGGRAG